MRRADHQNGAVDARARVADHDPIAIIDLARTFLRTDPASTELDDGRLGPGRRGRRCRCGREAGLSRPGARLLYCSTNSPTRVRVGLDRRRAACAATANALAGPHASGSLAASSISVPIGGDRSDCLAERRRWNLTPTAGVRDPVGEHVGHSLEELGLADDLPRHPARHEDLDHDRAPAQRPAVVVVGAEVDRGRRRRPRRPRRPRQRRPSGESRNSSSIRSRSAGGNSSYSSPRPNPAGNRSHPRLDQRAQP